MITDAPSAQAVQWFQNGDHPLDKVGDWVKDPVYGSDYIRREGAVVRFFRHPEISGDVPCKTCGAIADVHGWIDSGGDGHKVCPGDYIVQDEDGEYVPRKEMK